ncbi:MAG: YwiC-like family protein [Bacilli bacterium]|nr:YwiC-like family protein [Bacilli bacterium]MBN2877288.1 YwiC-like family protein [Bacilli bacterium]
MNKIKRFVSGLLKDFFNEQDKKELIEILTTSLEEKVDDLVEQGKSREEAIETSIKEFGDTKDVLEAFPEIKNNNIKRKRRNQVWFSVGAYLIITGLTVYIDLWLTPQYLWFIFVAIGLLFWPLVMLYLYFQVRR